jgi:hypothetical protein
MNPRTGTERNVLFGILSSTWIAQACYAVTKLGVPDLLAAGPRSATDLAKEVDADERALYRVLRALATAGLLTESAGRMFALRRHGELLRSDVPGSLRPNSLIYGEEVIRSFTEIMYTLRTGRPAFDKVHGTSFYAYLDEHPEIDQIFTSAQGVLEVPPALAACDLTGVATLVDIGGGDGALLAEILQAHQAMRGVLVDRPEVIRQAKHRLDGIGDRVEFIDADFFRFVPDNADAYVLSRVLHNWTDDKAAEILRTVRAAMPENGRLIILEDTVPDGGQDRSASLVDLLMLVMMEGYDRTEAEYHELLTTSGFRVTATHRAPGARGAVNVAIEAGRA